MLVAFNPYLVNRQIECSFFRLVLNPHVHHPELSLMFRASAFGNDDILAVPDNKTRHLW